QPAFHCRPGESQDPYRGIFSARAVADDLRTTKSWGYGSRIALAYARLSGTTEVVFRFKISGTRNTRSRPRDASGARVMRNHCPSKSEGAGKTGCWPHPQPRVQ